MLNACRRTLPVELFFAKTPASLYLPCLAPSLNLMLLTKYFINISCISFQDTNPPE